MIYLKLKVEFKCKRRSQHKFSINRWLAIIWPTSPYECKTYTWIMHTCVHKIDIDHLSLLDSLFIAFFSVHRFFVCGCIAKTFKILLETCTVWVRIICFSLFGATPLWIVPIASDTWSTHIFCIYWNHRLRAVSLHKTMIVSILAVHTQNRRLNTVCKMRKNIREETRCVRFTYGTWFLLLVLLNIFNINIRKDAAETAYQFCSWFCLLILFLFTRKIRFKQKN